jgi:cytochrome c peroxidase
MKGRHRLFTAAVALSSTALAQAFPPHQPAYMPAPPAPPENPTTVERALLGKALFWDEQMSSTRTVACGTCHRHNHGGCDPRAIDAVHPGADGAFGTADDARGSAGVVQNAKDGDYRPSEVFGLRPQVTRRRALPVINAAYENELMWDGAAGSSFHDPETKQLLLPEYAALESEASYSPIDSSKMAHLGRTWDLVAREMGEMRPLALASDIPPDLAAFLRNRNYEQLFTAVFGSPRIDVARVSMALASYQRTLISDQSLLDLSLAGVRQLPEAAQRGQELFERHCASCHSDLESHEHPATNDFRRTGVRPIEEDVGRFGVTNNPEDLGKFKVPGLRNVALRAPYMHNGGLPTLRAVLDFYNRGGDHGPGIDPLVAAIRGQLSAQDKDDLIAFLQCLTDPRVEGSEPPFDRPRLWTEGPNVPTRLGAPTSGNSRFSPQVVALSPPFHGNRRFTVAAENVPPEVDHSLFLDFARLPTPGILLGHSSYLAKSQLRFYGCGKTRRMPDGTGYASKVLEVPADPFLIGLRIYGQWFFADEDGPGGFVSSSTFTAVVF